MKAFDNEIAGTLTNLGAGDIVETMQIGLWDLQVAVPMIGSISTAVKSTISISGKKYEWSDDTPNSAPYGLLVGQEIASFELTDPYVLRMNLKSGDYVEFYSDESQYEAVVIHMGMKDGCHLMEIF
ncbi:hypothetical protein [uncultured Roseibium sp.]|uniref:hypothetical protein n=1 Tax=uncultured Roseibium sp. TaxID=1936171 RepID=UPI00321721A0